MNSKKTTEVIGLIIVSMILIAMGAGLFKLIVWMFS